VVDLVVVKEVVEVELEVIKNQLVLLLVVTLYLHLEHV
jgi:hypothetical protein|tara:strand:- start:569 stop:682 length:114 start_codon:yes stop_codon:yes gene_type:complete